MYQIDWLKGRKKNYNFSGPGRTRVVTVMLVTLYPVAIWRLFYVIYFLYILGHFTWDFVIQGL